MFQTPLNEGGSGAVVSLQVFLQTVRVALIVCLVVSQNSLEEALTVHPCQHGYQVPGSLLCHRGQREKTTAARDSLLTAHVCCGGRRGRGRGREEGGGRRGRGKYSSGII